MLGAQPDVAAGRPTGQIIAVTCVYPQTSLETALNRIVTDNVPCVMPSENDFDQFQFLQ